MNKQEFEVARNSAQIGYAVGVILMALATGFAFSGNAAGAGFFAVAGIGTLLPSLGWCLLNVLGEYKIDE